MKIHPDKLNFREAKDGAVKIREIYSHLKIWVNKGSDGYIINYSHLDGSYHKTMQYKESLEDYLRIHSEPV